MSFFFCQSQNEDLQTEYGRLKVEHEDWKDTHQKQDEQRDTEYKQLKQEKDLEISSLKGNIIISGQKFSYVAL